MTSLESVERIAEESRVDGNDGEPGKAALAVASLLARRGIPKSRQAATVSDILGLSYSAGNRRMTTSASWSLEELERVADHFNETLADLLNAVSLEKFVDASIIIDGNILSCRVSLGPIKGQVAHGTVLATEVDGAWRVFIADGRPTIPANLVTNLSIKPVSKRRRIAVLEDHPDTAIAIQLYLQDAGFEAVTFNAPQNLYNQNDFDAYVLDWVIERDLRRVSALELIQNIRDRNTHCPVIILTGQIGTGNVEEREIASALAKFDLKFFAKPASMPILTAALNASFKVA